MSTLSHCSIFILTMIESPLLITLASIKDIKDICCLKQCRWLLWITEIHKFYLLEWLRSAWFWYVGSICHWFLNFILIYINSIFIILESPTIYLILAFNKLNKFTIFIKVHLSLLETFWTVFAHILLQHYNLQCEAQISVTLVNWALRRPLCEWEKDTQVQEKDM